MKVLPPGAIIYKAVGCSSCSQSGYAGRTVIHELMVIDDKVRSLNDRLTTSGTLRDAAALLVAQRQARARR